MSVHVHLELRTSIRSWTTTRPQVAGVHAVHDVKRSRLQVDHDVELMMMKMMTFNQRCSTWYLAICTRVQLEYRFQVLVLVLVLEG